MATNADVLNFAQSKLIPKWTEQFYQYHPVLDKVVLKGNIERQTHGGPFLEFPVVTNGPGAVTKIENGSEVYSSTRRNVGERGKVYCPRMIYSYVIPGKDLSEATGETAIARLLKVYPEAALMEFHEYIVSQFVNGDGATNNVDGFMTLNGDTHRLVLLSASTKLVLQVGKTSSNRFLLSRLMVVLRCAVCTGMLHYRASKVVQLTVCSAISSASTTTTTILTTKFATKSNHPARKVYVQCVKESCSKKLSSMSSLLSILHSLLSM